MMSNREMDQSSAAKNFVGTAVQEEAMVQAERQRWEAMMERERQAKEMEEKAATERHRQEAEKRKHDEEAAEKTGQEAKDRARLRRIQEATKGRGSEKADKADGGSEQAEKAGGGFEKLEKAGSEPRPRLEAEADHLGVPPDKKEVGGRRRNADEEERGKD